MTKKALIKGFLWAFLLVIGVILAMLPAPYADYASMFCPALLFSVATAVLTGTFGGTVLGGLTTVLVYLINTRLRYLPGVFLPDTLILAVSMSFAGLSAGIAYNLFHSGIGSALLGVLGSRVVYGLGMVIGNFIYAKPYSIETWFHEGIIAIWPGLLLPLALVPLLVLIFRQSGLMELLRNERLEK